jgi:hypothetical protein
LHHFSHALKVEEAYQRVDAGKRRIDNPVVHRVDNEHLAVARPQQDMLPMRLRVVQSVFDSGIGLKIDCLQADNGGIRYGL